MASITFAIDEDIQGRIKEFSWVNWSEIAREELLQKYKMQISSNSSNLKENKN